MKAGKKNIHIFPKCPTFSSSLSLVLNDFRENVVTIFKNSSLNANHEDYLHYFSLDEWEIFIKRMDALFI